jgi:GR25 family glycosyltransferase involved in LPS biosynthesis
MSRLLGVNEVFDAVAIINVARHVERRRRSAARFTAQGIAHAFAEAVDGEDPSVQEAYARYLERSAARPEILTWERTHERKALSSPGAYAYLLSMQRVLRDANDRGLRRILVCDDDCIFIDDFAARFAAVVSRVPADWKILKFGASDLRLSAVEHEEHSRVGYYPIRRRCDGSFAVGVDASVFAELLLELAHMDFPYDSGALTTVCAAHPGKCFELCPNLIIADVRESTIRAGQDLAAFAARAQWELRLYRL